MAHFVGLDVSVRQTTVCDIDDAGQMLCERKVPAEPDDIAVLLTSIGGGSVGRIFPFVTAEVEAALRTALRSDYQMPNIEMSELGTEGPANGAAFLLHQRMFSVDEKAVFPKGDVRGLIRVSSV